MTEHKSDKGRFLFVKLFAVASALLLVARFASIMLFSDPAAVSARRNRTTVERGPILDRNGRILAIQNRLANVSAWLPNVKDAEATSRLLAPILGMPESEIHAKLTGSGPNYVTLKRKISPSESAAIEALKAQGSLGGISLEPSSGRSYPGKTLASHAVGFAGTDNIGLSGIEYTMNGYLAPVPDDAAAADVVYGNQVYLTLDVNIQHFAERTVARLVEEHQADSAMLLVMKADTGEILGYASTPDYDPNTFYVFDDSHRKNRPISLLYEPGSVFKIFSLGAFMQAGGITEHSTFLCNGEYTNEYLDEPIKCLGAHGYVTPVDILKYSCNAGAAYASETVTSETFYSVLRQFGFGGQTGIELNGEEYGILRNPSQWSMRSKPSISMGQEIAVTAVQVAAAATVYANDGVLLRPHIVKRIVSPDGTVLRENGREAVRRVLSPEVAGSVLEMMTAVAETGGTGYRAGIEGLSISMKTGTAELFDHAAGKYSDDEFIASSLAIFPTDDPQLIVYVVIESPRGQRRYGGQIAAPVIKEAAEFLLPYLDVPFPGNRVVTHSGRVTVRVPPEIRLGSTVPDFTGYPKRSLLPLFERTDLTVKITGDGYVTRQNPAAGTPVTEGMTITLELE
jgi:cell division protein FtsI (penicillin-binding protein 3)